MYARQESLGISGAVTTILRDLIHERLGLFYDTGQFDQLADRLSSLVVARGLSSFMDYYYLLKYSEDRAEWARVMDALSIQETYFWREIDQLRALVACVVPQVAASLGSDPLRIWSVPCATGEEPLTIAMLLDEAGWFDRMPIEIVASDASPAAIARAKEGRYTERSFRHLPLGLRDKYFTQCEQRWKVVPSLHARIAYDVANLVSDDQVERHAAVPIIVCRNVLIYFSDQSIRHVLRLFERSMPPVAYLCVGAAESLLRRTTTFELQEIGGAFMYVKNAAGAAAGGVAQVGCAS